MSVIGATRLQFKKSAFAQEVSQHLVDDRANHDLFHVATTIEATSHIIAAIVGSDTPALLECRPMSDGVMFDALFSCLRLLFIKQVQGNTLSQGEQLTLSLANRYAKKLNDEDEFKAIQTNIDLVMKLFKQSQSLALQEARSHRSMC